MHGDEPIRLGSLKRWLPMNHADLPELLEIIFEVILPGRQQHNRRYRKHPTVLKLFAETTTMPSDSDDDGHQQMALGGLLRVQEADCENYGQHVVLSSESSLELWAKFRGTGVQRAAAAVLPAAGGACRIGCLRGLRRRRSERTPAPNLRADRAGGASRHRRAKRYRVVRRLLKCRRGSRTGARPRQQRFTNRGAGRHQRARR